MTMTPPPMPEILKEVYPRLEDFIRALEAWGICGWDKAVGLEAQLAEAQNMMANSTPLHYEVATLRARVSMLTEALESLGIEVAEWHPINDCANEIYKLRTALERIRDEIDYSFDEGNPNKIRSIAIDALAKGDHEPF